MSSIIKLNNKSAKSLDHVQLFVTLWTVAYQASLSMGFSRQEILEWKEERKEMHFLLQGIFLTQGLNLGLLHRKQILYNLIYQEAQ